MRELRAADERRRHVDPALPARLVMDRLAVDNLFRRVEGAPTLDMGDGVGLIGAGIAVVVGMLAD